MRIAAIAPLLTICALAASGSVSAEVPSAPPDIAAQPQPVTLFLVRRKWHIDVGFAAAELTIPLKRVAAPFARAKYVFFGFGDRHFLLARHPGSSTTVGALWPGAGLILVTAIEGSPRAAFGGSDVIEFSVSADDASKAQAFIWNSIAAEAGDRTTAYAPGPYDDSAYFSAVPRYSAAHTCNTWAAESLRAAGLPIRSRGVLFAGQLWRAVLKANAAGTRASRLPSTAPAFAPPP